ncbi:YihY/virulence factor BrkB family protein [bacterium]|nr:YihY/virulence factor BrkB family protein [bacterium]
MLKNIIKNIIRTILKNRYAKFFYNIVRSIIKNDFFGMASEMGFILLAGFFTFLLFLMTVFGWMGNRSYMQPIMLALSNMVPHQAMELIYSVLNQTMIFDHGKIMAIVGITMSIVLSSNAIAVVLKGLNRAYKVEETRSFVYTRILSFLMMLVDTLILFLAINIIIFGKVIVMFLLQNLNISPAIAVTILTLRWPVAFLALYLMAFLSYYILPDLKGKESFKRKSELPGTVFFTTLWLVGSWGFSVYVNNFSTYNMLYGAIGAFFILMVWLYFTSIILLIGGEINSRVYNRLERKSIELHEEIKELRRMQNLKK